MNCSRGDEVTLHPCAADQGWWEQDAGSIGIPDLKQDSVGLESSLTPPVKPRSNCIEIVSISASAEAVEGQAESLVDFDCSRRDTEESGKVLFGKQTRLRAVGGLTRRSFGGHRVHARTLSWRFSQPVVWCRVRFRNHSFRFAGGWIGSSARKPKERCQEGFASYFGDFAQVVMTPCWGGRRDSSIPLVRDFERNAA